jgi:carbon-monoxide dehydrogenase medium subunit
MFPADFAYARARSLDEAFDLLDEAHAAEEEAKLIAGGQSLLPMMKLRLAAPQVLIDIADIPDLKGGGWHTIGALTTYRQLHLSDTLTSGIPAIADALAALADPQVRARGTIGGAVAHGDPAADIPPVLLALNAELAIASRAGKRTTSLDDFLQGIYTTDLAEDEIVTHISIRTPGARGSAYEKFPHPASHLPLAGVCAVVRLQDGLISGAEVAVTGISPRPYRARAAEQILVAASPTPEVLAAAAAQITKFPDGQELSLLGDQHASAHFRAHLAEVLTRRALSRALTRASERQEP